MAISKLIPIKATLNKAIDYIMDPEKTGNGRLVSAFGCSPETADIEMQITADKGSRQGNRIGYHLIQSFAPEDDITPEKALELGKEFTNIVTGGKYEYVIATHIDQGHIHNHIIFNATSFVDRKKYHSDQSDKYRIRRSNDKICKANNLSVIKPYPGKKGYGKYEYMKRKEKVSWKQQIENMIDSVISRVSSFDEFIEHMELEGYEIKRGKHISFRAPGQERFCRGKTIGTAYTEEVIRERIENKELEKIKPVKESEKEIKPQKVLQKNMPKRKLNLIVDISKNIKAQQSKGYEQALVKENINTLVKTMNYLIQHDLKTPEEFNKHYSAIVTDFNFLKRNGEKLSGEILQCSEKIKFTQNYKKNKKIYLQSLSAINDYEFYKNHEEEIVQYKASLIYFERAGINPEELSLNDLFQKYKGLKQEKVQNSNLYKEIKAKKYELDIIKQNMEYALDYEISGNAERATSDKEINTRRNDLR